MIPIQIKIISYNKGVNTCKAELQSGKIIELDPYVGCAIELTDDEYYKGKGNKVVGKSYVLTRYSVYEDSVVPHENGMIEL